MKMKSLFKNIICVTAVSLAVSSLVYADEAEYYVNGIKAESAAPQYKGDWMLVPIKPIGESLGFEFSTNENKLIFQKEESKITFIPGIWRAYVEGVEKKIAYPVYVENDVAYAEINDLSKVFNCTIDYSEEERNFKVTLKGAQSEETVARIEAPKIKIENKEPNIFSSQTKSNGVYLTVKKPYETVWENSGHILNNIYRARISESIKFSFEGQKPDSVKVQWEALPEYNEEGIAEVYPSDIKFVEKNGTYEFIHPIAESDVMIYIISASWGGNSFDYIFVMDNTKVIAAVEDLDNLIAKMDIANYTVVGGKVYYIDNSNLSEIREMLLDGTGNIVVGKFPKSQRITDDFDITSEYYNGVIEYKLQETGKYGDIDVSDNSVMPTPKYYRFNINTREVTSYKP
ncbi:MAG: copper amine oxidase N-terminal domain-containing protein [Firmicutes bacterium]|nr:copper amine oxidase N-terminal domain-containing protein [Bacillota bacterium]